MFWIAALLFAAACGLSLTSDAPRVRAAGGAAIGLAAILAAVWGARHRGVLVDALSIKTNVLLIATFAATVGGATVAFAQTLRGAAWGGAACACAAILWLLAREELDSAVAVFGVGAAIGLLVLRGKASNARSSKGLTGPNDKTFDSDARPEHPPTARFHEPWLTTAAAGLLSLVLWNALLGSPPSRSPEPRRPIDRINDAKTSDGTPRNPADRADAWPPLTMLLAACLLFVGLDRLHPEDAR